MKLEQNHISFIENVVKTGQSVNIDNVIIEDGLVRAIDEARTVVLFQDENVPEMPFGSIGLNRIGVFLSRLELAKSRDNFTADAVVEQGEEFSRSITMKGAGLKVDYRCANPSTIQAPRQINDHLIYRVQLNAEAVALLQKGQVAMGSVVVNIALTEAGVAFELADVNNDIFNHTFADSVEMLDEDGADTFAHKYPVKTLLALFKQNPEGHFDIGAKGILSITVNGLNIFVLPQV